MPDIHDLLAEMHPPIYAAVVADRCDPFTIDQRYADADIDFVYEMGSAAPVDVVITPVEDDPIPERDPLLSVDAMNRPALRDELLSRGITTIEGRRLANTSTALMRVALANARWNRTGEA